MTPSDIKMDEQADQLLHSDGAAEIVRRLISKGSVVLDVGANAGEWSDLVLRHQPDVKIHCFEPVPSSNAILTRKLADHVAAGRVVANCIAVGRGVGEARQMTVPVTTIDAYCEAKGIQHVDFLKVDTAGGELDVLVGAQRMLKAGRIAHLQFQYGASYLEAKITLRQVFDLLDAQRYAIFKVMPRGAEYVPVFREELENFESAGYVAVNERLAPTQLGRPPKMLNLRALLMRHRITPRGVIHIGAHEGGDLRQYVEMGVKRVLYIEANPETFQRLSAAIDGTPGVMAAYCAIADHDGTATLHVTSEAQSSSILPLKRHREIYPNIVEVKTVTVPCRTLDTLLAELGIDAADYNVINIDIQGAELLALTGAEQALRHIVAINSEVNYQELYAGCATVWELDGFLEQRGFERVATVTPYHPSWGDALYVKRPVVTMSTLGSNGRFGNQIFQYAFLRIHALKHLLYYETAPWIGQQLFGRQDPPISCQLPTLQEPSEAAIPNDEDPCRGVDFRGCFQYHTSYYAHHKEFFRSLFEPAPSLRSALEEVYGRIRTLGKTVVGIHLGRGDDGRGDFFVAPNQWYLDWLKEIWPTLDNPVLFIASDEPEAVLEQFAPYRPVTCRSLGISLEGADFYPDFYLLSRCDVTAISNSSFSFAACMLNRSAQSFFRPNLAEQRLVPFDPWNGEVILRDATVEGVRQAEAASSQPSILFLNVYYNGFLGHIYHERPDLARQPYAVQKQQLIGELFGDSDYYSHNLALNGWRADDIVVNAAPAQAAWAREHNFSGDDFEVVIEQIRSFTPDVLYIHDMYAYPQPFLERVRGLVRVIAGQIASPMADGTPFHCYDLIFSSFPHFVERFSQAGINSVLQPLAFEPRVLSQLQRYDYQERPVGCSFVGGISKMHRKGNELLETLVARTPLQVWGYGAESLPPESLIRGRHNGEAWGRAMYSVMAASRITVNRHIDVAENHANNLRLYEATGCGALLITDYKDDLAHYFEIGKEVVVYRSPEECARLVNYYLEHPVEAQAIAEAGQRRTLRDHGYISRMGRTGSILRSHIEKKLRLP